MQYLRDGSGSQCALPISTDAHHVSLGASSFHPYSTSITYNAPSILRQIQVIILI